MAKENAGNGRLNRAADILLLECTAGPSKGTVFGKQAERITLGRTKASTVHLKDLSVSEKHGEFEWDGVSWRFTDVDSSNGSRLNGVVLVPFETAALQTGDVLTVGEPSNPSVLQIEVRAAPDADLTVENFVADEVDRLIAGIGAVADGLCRELRANLKSAHASLKKAIA